MTWFLYSGGRRTAIADGVECVVGRAPECDVVVDDPRVSRRHVSVLVRDSAGDGAPGTWTVTDTSSNGTFAEGSALRTRTGESGLALHLGSPDGPTVVLTTDPAWVPAIVDAPAVSTQPARRGVSIPYPNAAPNVEVTGLRALGVGVRIGRSADNDLVLDDLLVSLHHAHVRRDGYRTEVVDLASARGTYVNGQRVQRADLTPGDRIGIGGTSLVFTGEGLEPVQEAGGVPLIASHIQVTIGGNNILHDVSFELPPRSVLAVIGPSGSGKSTLLGALTGQRPAEGGSVMVGDRDLYAGYDELRQWIGFVPQSDLLHTQLRVQQALEYGAKLRFPRDTTAEQRRARVIEVLDELGLSERAGLRIDRLSGGQRKRTSVALELLTRPTLLYLDEPTSGLDPGLDRQVMLLLRELADDGRTVVVVTHAVENLALCDRVLILAAGGWVAYYGPPADAPAHFGAEDYPGIFLALERTPGPEWQRRHDRLAGRTTGAQDAAPAYPPPGYAPVGYPGGPVPGAAAVAAASTPVRAQSAWAQLRTLMGRYLHVIGSDRAYVLFLVLMPLVLATLGVLSGNEYGLGFADPDPPENPYGLNPQANSLLLIMALGATFAGTATAVQELVKERTIYQRERSVGLSRTAYVLSKAVVLLIIGLLQGLVFALLTLVGRPGPTEPLVLPNGHLEIAVAVAALAVASAMLGLVLSALLPTREVALPVLVIATMVQLTMSGAMPLRFSQGQRLLGWLAPSYWGFDSMAASTDLNAVLGHTGDDIVARWLHEPVNWWLGMGALAAMSVIFVALTVVLLRRWDPGRR